jgi:hypothetical protein
MRQILFLLILITLSHSVFSQQINLIKKRDSTKTKTIRIDKKITIKTFDGEKFKGEWQVLNDERIRVQEREVMKDNIMMISGFVQSNSKDRAVGIGLTVGAGLVFPVAVYYFLGGIAWGFSNGIFVGATVLVFDLLLAYAGTTMMGVIPRRFSTLNWEIELSTQPVPIRLPVPVD